jgi:glycerophosphoryl diester phosphodiesterase
VKENTMAAFEQAAAAGVWGIEFDLRWTRDLQPVVIHDADTRRVFDLDLVISGLSLAELRQQLPQIPTLTDVVQRFGGRQHMMIELKTDAPGAAATCRGRLREALAGLEGARDYHFLALDFELFRLVEFAGKSACLPVAELNTRNFSQQCLAQGLGGVCGQYLLLSSGMIQRHHHNGQKVGCGFISSRFSLYRELNRGVDWIYTDHARKLCLIRRQLLSR